MFSGLCGGEEVFDAEERALANDGEDPLVGVGSGEAGKLISRFQGYPDSCLPAEVDEAFQTIVPAFAGYADVVEPPRAGSDGLLDRMKAVENFHLLSLLSEWKNRVETVKYW